MYLPNWQLLAVHSTQSVHQNVSALPLPAKQIFAWFFWGKTSVYKKHSSVYMYVYTILLHCACTMNTIMFVHVRLTYMVCGYINTWSGLVLESWFLGPEQGNRSTGLQNHYKQIMHVHNCFTCACRPRCFCKAAQFKLHVAASAEVWA